jgi:hypothetical protein
MKRIYGTTNITIRLIGWTHHFIVSHLHALILSKHLFGEGMLKHYLYIYSDNCKIIVAK